MIFDSNNPLVSNAIEIVKTINNNNGKAYFVGGCVRDCLLNLPIKDIDIACDIEPEKIKQIFNNANLVGQSFGVIVVKWMDGYHYEIATFRKDGKYLDCRRPSSVNFGSLEEDAFRRDFTVNSLYYDPIDDNILDPTGQGIDDLKNKRIRCIKDANERFQEDALRLMRAIRFSSKLNFFIETSTFRSICLNSILIKNIASERIRDELTLMFIHKNGSKALELLLKTHLLHIIIPEIIPITTTDHGYLHHPEGSLVKKKIFDRQSSVVVLGPTIKFDPNIHNRNDFVFEKPGTVWDHTLRVLDLLPERNIITAWSAILHDIGKPNTVSKKEDGEYSFYNHDSIGADIAKKILERLRFSKEQVDEIYKIISMHMNYKNLTICNKSTFKRTIADPSFENGFKVFEADGKSCGKAKSIIPIKERMEQYANEPVMPKCLINGEKLIELGVTPGPKLGKIKNIIYDAQLNGDVIDEEQAIELAKLLLTDKEI